MPYFQKPSHSMADIAAAESPAIRLLSALLMPSDPAEAATDMVNPLAAMVRLPLNRAMKFRPRWISKDSMEGALSGEAAYNPHTKEVVVQREPWKNPTKVRKTNPGPPLRQDADKNALRRYTLRHEEGHGVYDELPKSVREAFEESADKRIVHEQGDDVADYHNWWDRRMSPDNGYLEPRSEYQSEDRFHELFADIFAGSHEPETMLENMLRILDNPVAERVLRELLESHR